MSSNSYAILRNPEDAQSSEEAFSTLAPEYITGDEPEGKRRKDNHHQTEPASTVEDIHYVETQEDTESDCSMDQSPNSHYTDSEESNISDQETQANALHPALVANSTSQVQDATPANSVVKTNQVRNSPTDLVTTSITKESQGVYIPDIHSSEEIPSSLDTQLLNATANHHYPPPLDAIGIDPEGIDDRVTENHGVIPLNDSLGNIGQNNARNRQSDKLVGKEDNDLTSSETSMEADTIEDHPSAETGEEGDSRNNDPVITTGVRVLRSGKSFQRG